MDIKIIDEYTDSMKAGASFPALTVYKVDDNYYLVDGYHRFMAAQGARLTNILCDIRTGTMRDATLFSAGVNATHGLRRTNEDKRRAVAVLLRDEEWGAWSDTKIAEICHVSVDLVANVKKSILGETDRYRRKNSKVERGGKVYKMDTTRIGKTRSETAAAAPPVTPGDVARKEKFGGSESPQPSLAAQVAGAKAPEIPATRSPPCLGGGGCDQKPSRWVPNDGTGRGPVCSAIGAPVNQLPGGKCPYDVKLERTTAANTSFERASDGTPSSIAAARPLYGPRSYLIKKEPRSREEIARRTQDFVEDLPEQTQREITALIKADSEGLFSEDPRELIIELIRERAEQLEA